MSVLIKDMKMPKSCKSCDLLQDYDGDMYCPLNSYLNFGDIEYVPDYVMLECPISEAPEQRWTPCTPDTMPSENDAYIVTCVGEGTKWTDVAEYSKRHKGWRYGLHSDNIIAWMPLPEPYKEMTT